MEFWRDVRRQVLTGELSRRAACRKYGLGWHTLKKILSHEEPPGYRQSEPRPKRKLEPFLPIIHQILTDDRQAPKKQRHTARRIFERLRDEHGYQGGQTVVKDAVRAWKQSRQEVFLPLSHPPGEAQVDFGEATIRLAGQETKVALFVMTLPYSGAIFIQVFPRECTETFLEGHRRAFEFFGGVPKRISYDNSAIAVIEVLSGRERKLTREFLRLQSHYLFREHFCLVRRANEKGHVERLLGFARRSFLVPVPQVDSLESLNAQLRERCLADLTERTRGKPAPKGQLLLEDQAAFLPLPKQPFEARRIVPASADSQSLVRFDTNDYSVPVKYAAPEVDRRGHGGGGPTGVRRPARGPASAVLGSRADLLRADPLPGAAWSASPAGSITPGPWRTGRCRSAFPCCDAGWKRPIRVTGHAPTSACCGCWRSSLCHS